MPWHSIHVHYHQLDLDDLVLDAVRPLFAELSEPVAAAYFVRHWRRGPHVRLNFQVAPGRFEVAVRPVAEQALSEFLARRPSQTTLDPQQLLPLHQRLAKAEQEDGSLVPWLPDNSLRVRPFASRSTGRGGEAAAALQAGFLSDTTEIAFEMIDDVRAGRPRQQIAFDLMIAIAHSFGGGVENGFVSYRSHAEAFLAAEAADSPTPEHDPRRLAWEQQYRRHAPALVNRVRQVVAAIEGTGPPVRFVRDWIGLLDRYRERGRALVESGAVSAPTGRALPARNPLWRSEFHRALASNDDFHRRVKHSVEFGVWRLWLNYTYLQLTRVGLTPYQRFLVCHLAANAVEEAYQTSALARIKATLGSVA